MSEGHGGGREHRDRALRGRLAYVCQKSYRTVRLDAM